MTKHPASLVIASHAALVDGRFHEMPVGTLLEILNRKSKTYYYLRHSLSGDFESQAYFYQKGKVSQKYNLKVWLKLAPIRYMTELLATIGFVRRLTTPITYIGVDPLNALAGVWLKKTGRVDKLVFYCADYADKRFENSLMNRVYHYIDQYVIKRADFVWNVSTRIHQKRTSQGLPESTNILVPNVPDIDLSKYKARRHQYDLVTLGLLDVQFDFSNLLKAVKVLKKNYPKIHVKIIGDGPKRSSYESQVKRQHLSKYFTFYGFVDHARALELISTSGVGLALYNGRWNFNYYGDSMKCREFFAFGLPVLTTDTHSTVEEIEKVNAGAVTNQTTKGYVNGLENIWQHYKTYSQQAFSLHLVYSGIHEKLLKGL